MTPERLAEIRDRVTYNPEDWPITIELVAHIDTITAENDRLKGEVERLERLNASLRYDHDLFKLAALRVETTLRADLDALVTAGEAVVNTCKYISVNEGRSNEVEVYTTDEKAIAVLRAALAAAKEKVGG